MIKGETVRLAIIILAVVTMFASSQPVNAQEHEWWILRPGAEKWLVDFDDMFNIKELNIVAEEGDSDMVDLSFISYLNGALDSIIIFTMSVDETGDYWCHASNGIYFKRIDDHETLNPLCIVDDPLEVGKAWADTVYIGNDYTGVDYIYDFECVAEEELVLPAGTFHTFEIRYEIYTRNGDFWTLSWVERKSHCDGVGLVRLILEDSPWGDGELELTSVYIPVGVTTPSSPRVSISSYPNPFNPQTTISFSLERNEWASVGVHDLTGRRISSLADRTFTAGPQTLTWNGHDSQGRAMPSGTYIVRLETESGAQSRKVMLVR